MDVHIPLSRLWKSNNNDTYTDSSNQFCHADVNEVIFFTGVLERAYSDGRCGQYRAIALTDVCGVTRAVHVNVPSPANNDGKLARRTVLEDDNATTHDARRRPAADRFNTAD